jgi:hypothetical protein
MGGGTDPGPVESTVSRAYTPGEMMKLPGWVVDNRTAVAREAAPYRRLSPLERLRLTAIACRGSARQLAARPDRRRLLDHLDPLPASTVAALDRLRRARTSA